MRITFAVPGVPQPAGSKRAFPFQKKDGELGVAVSDDNPKARDWKATVAWTAVAARNAAGLYVLLDGPLRVAFDFELPRPKGQFGKDGLSRKSAPPYPIGRPDLLKLARAVEDAMQGVIYRNDSQIVMEQLQKRWGMTAVLHVILETL